MPEDFSKRALGLVPSKPDPRDYQQPRYSSAANVATLPVAYTVPNQPPIRDQGSTPTCVGHALAALMEQALLTKGFKRALSVLAGYVGARSLEYPPPAEGTSLRDGLIFAQRFGIAPDADWPFLAGKGQPGPFASTNALLTRVGGFAVVPRVPLEIKAALTRTQMGVIVALDVTPGFDAPDAQGLMHPGGAERGSHAVVVVGYDDARQAFRIRNSWGTGWGQGGYAWRPYSMPFTEAYTATVIALEHLPAPKPWWAWLFGG